MNKHMSNHLITNMAEQYTLYRAFGLSKVFSFCLTIGTPIIGAVGVFILAEWCYPCFLKYIFQ